MTWEELKEEAKKMWYELKKEYTESLEKDLNKDMSIAFQEFGEVWLSLYTEFCDTNASFAEHRTPDQMLAIMKALQ